MLSGMFSVSEAEAAAIRAAYEQGREPAAAVELRRYFAGIDSTAGRRNVGGPGAEQAPGVGTIVGNPGSSG